MKDTSRRDFLKTSALLPFIFRENKGYPHKKMPLLSFSTLGCPDWPFDKILEFASVHKYDGIELRGLLGELDLLKCPEFSSLGKTRDTRKRIEDRGLRIVD